jgi:hypothetical protein
MASWSLGPYSGERGRAMSPVRADSRMPKGAMSFMNESIRVGFAELYFRQSIPQYNGLETYTSTIQQFVLISKTFPPN